MTAPPDHPGARPGQIVALNGAPRSGKSSIVAVIQESFPGIWMNTGVDRFMPMAPARLHPGIGLRPGGEAPHLEPTLPVLYAALYESVAAHSRLGLNVVVDVGHHDDYSTPLGILPDCARRLTGLPVLFVGVLCPLAVIMERRRATGWPGGEDGGVPAPVLRWQDAVHRPGKYDMELDTSLLSAEACAAAIRRRLEDGPPGQAFALLAVSAPPG